MSMKPPAWKRPKTKVYDYNYNLGEHYYKPQLKHADLRYQNRAATPPKAKTFAERFAEDPVYGNNSPYDYRSTAERPFESSLPPRRTSLQDDLGLGSGAPRRPLFESRGLTPDLDDFRPSRPRLNFGERLLEAAGRRPEVRFGDDTNFRRAFTPDADDPFDEPFFQQRKKLLPPRSADAAFGSEDPFKRRVDALNFDDDDEFFNSGKKDTESIVAGFRSRMRARRQRDEEAAEESSPFESRVDKIRSRAKARLADLEDDLPALSLRDRDNSRGRGFRDFDDLDSSLTSGASKSLRITKRTVKSTVDDD